MKLKKIDPDALINESGFHQMIWIGKSILNMIYLYDF